MKKQGSFKMKKFLYGLALSFFLVSTLFGQFGAWLAYRGAKAVLLDGSQENKVSE
jgi:hypothetical protein